MQMKDKIYRNNHSKTYYYLKKIGIYSGAFVGAFVLFAIPVSIVRAIVSLPQVERNESREVALESSVNEMDSLERF